MHRYLYPIRHHNIYTIQEKMNSPSQVEAPKKKSPTRAKKPSGAAATKFYKQYQRSPSMILKRAHIKSICRRELNKISNMPHAFMLSLSFIHAVMAKTQKHVLDRLKNVYSYAKFKNNVDENLEPLLINEDNIIAVLGVMKEMDFPVRTFKPAKPKDNSGAHMSEIMKKIEETSS